MALYPPERTPVAQDIMTYCTREKDSRWHVVRNHNAQGIVDRVLCKCCGSEHKYRPSKDPESTATEKKLRRVVSTTTSAGAKKSSSVKATAAKVSSAVLEEQWFEGIKVWGEKPVISYDPKLSYAVGAVLRHSHFGKGVVQRLRERKMDVLFKDSLRTLPAKG